MADITVTIPNSTFTIDTISNGIEVTTPTSVEVNVDTNSNTIDITNTPQEITVLTSGTVILQSGITSVNGDTGPIVVLDTDDISEGATNQYFTQARARLSLSAGAGISYDNATGVITNTSINTDTTYTIDASTVSGGANFNLVGSDSTTDSIKIASGTNITVSRTDANTITIDGSDLNTTYAISSAATSGGANLTLTGSDASTDSVAYLGSGATTVTSTDANTITIASTDTNTTYTQNASAVSGGANLNLVGSDSTTDSIKLAGGSNVTVTRTDADTVTIASTDTNTTYTQNISSTSGGANLNLVGSDSTTDTVKFADGTGVTVSYTDANTATIAIGQSVGTGDSPTFAGITGGNITVGVATDQTITTTTGDLILDSTSGTVSLNVPTITTDATTLALFNTTATTVNAFGAATTTNIGTKTGSSIVNGTNRFTSPTIYGFSGGATTPSRGLMISNGNTGSFASARNNIVMRTFPTSAVTARGGLIFENTRGNETTPTALQTNDLVGEISATGYATNGYVGDFVASGPGNAYFYPTENWANTGGPYPTAGTVTNAGMGYIVALQPSATNVTTGNGSRINVLNINPQNFNCRSDAYAWNKGKTNNANMMSLFENSGKVGLTINQNRATSASDFALVNFQTQRSVDGVNYTPTLSGDNIGNFKFNGNAYTSTSPGVPAGPGASIIAKATENWTALANGTRFDFTAIQTGTLVDFTVISGSSDNLDLKSTQTRIQDVSGNAVLTVNATSATFAQPVGFPVKTAAAWNAITGAVGRQVSVSNSPTSGGRMAFWDTTNARWSYISDNSAI